MGFEPLTFCMPCTPVSSEVVRESLVSAGQSRATVSGRRAGSAGIWDRCHLICHWVRALRSLGSRPGHPDQRSPSGRPCRSMVLRRSDWFSERAAADGASGSWSRVTPLGCSAAARPSWRPLLPKSLLLAMATTTHSRSVGADLPRSSADFNTGISRQWFKTF